MGITNEKASSKLHSLGVGYPGGLLVFVFDFSWTKGLIWSTIGVPQFKRARFW